MKTNFLTLVLLFGTFLVPTHALAVSPMSNDDETQQDSYLIARIVLCSKEISSYSFKENVISILANTKSSVLIKITNLETEEKTSTRYDLNVGNNEIPLVLPQSQYTISIEDSDEVNLSGE